VLDDYLSLVKVRFGDRLSYTLKIPDNCKDLAIPSLLLQPLVENAVKHGIEPTIEGGEVTVSAQHIDTGVQLTVSDTGAGISTSHNTAISPEHQSNTNRGFGLSSLKQRLTETYGNRASIEISSPTAPDTTGTTVTLCLPRTAVNG